MTLKEELIEALVTIQLFGDVYNERGMFCRGCNAQIIKVDGQFKTTHRPRCRVAYAEKREVALTLQMEDEK